MATSHADNVPAARLLRGRLTESEDVLWRSLRDRQLDGIKFRRQHPVGAYVLDFYCAGAQLAVEIDGGIHRRVSVATSDRDRQMTLEEMGIAFLRLSDDRILADLDAVLDEIAERVRTLVALPSAHPLPQGRPSR